MRDVAALAELVADDARGGLPVLMATDLERLRDLDDLTLHAVLDCCAQWRRRCDARGGGMTNLDLPTVADLAAMPRDKQASLLAPLETTATEIGALCGALHALLLEPPRPAPLHDAKETARRLGVSVDTVRDRGAEWEFEVHLGHGLYRHDPERVEALRQRRRPQASEAGRVRGSVA